MSLCKRERLPRYREILFPARPEFIYNHSTLVDFQTLTLWYTPSLGSSVGRYKGLRLNNNREKRLHGSPMRHFFTKLKCKVSFPSHTNPLPNMLGPADAHWCLGD
jgi:hypothetical protein